MKEVFLDDKQRIIRKNAGGYGNATVFQNIQNMIIIIKQKK